MPRLARVYKHPAFAVQMFALALFLTVSSAARIRHGLKTREVVGVERQLMHLSPAVLAPLAAGRQGLLLELPGTENVVNYMFSLAVAHTSREAALLALRAGGAEHLPLPMEQFGAILTASGNPRFADAARCSTAQGRRLVVVDTLCLEDVPVAAHVPQCVAP